MFPISSPCRHVTSLGKQTSRGSNSTPTVKVTAYGLVCVDGQGGGAELAQLCKVLSICLDWWALITLNIVSSGGAEEADCLVGAACYCVAGGGASLHVTFTGRPIREEYVPHVLAVGREEVADLKSVTKAYQCIWQRCPLNLQICCGVYDWAAASCCIVNTLYLSCIHIINNVLHLNAATRL